MQLNPNLIAYIEAPEELNEAHFIIPRLIRVLDHVNKIANLDKLPELSSIPLWLQSCQNALQAQAAQGTNIESIDSLRGLYEKHQAYVTLSYVPRDHNLLTKHDILLAHLFVANASCHRLEDKGSVFKSSRKSAFTFARSIIKSTHIHELEQLPDTITSTEYYLSHLIELNDCPRVTSFIVFIRYALGIRKGVTREGGDGHRKHPARDREPVSENPDSGQPVVSGTITKLPMYGPVKEKELDRSGLSIGEFTYPLEITEVSFSDDKPLDGRTSADHIIRSKNVHKNMAMSNQMLISRWANLSMYEASCAAKCITTLYRSRITHKDQERQNELIELAALLAIMFWFSAPLEKAIRTVGYRIEPKSPTEAVTFVLSPQPFLLIKTAQPHYTSQVRKYSKLDIATHLQLTTGISVEQIIATYFQSIHCRKKLFSGTVEDYKGKVSGFLSSVNNQYGCRLTVGRLSSFMFEAIAGAANSEVTTGMLITGKACFVGATPIYYTATDSERLHSLYQKTCLHIAKNTQFEFQSEKRSPLCLKPFYPDKRMHGARLRPTKSEVSALCEKLKQDVLRAGKEDVIARHNAMSIYTAAFIHFSTGYRAVGDPSFKLDEVDFMEGFAVVSDKDSDDKYHSRLVWIPEGCLEQIKVYRSQLHKLLEYASVCLPAVYQKLSEELLGAIEKDNKDNKDKKSLPGFFLIVDENITTLTPKLYETFFPSEYPFPANAHRHFIRSNLLEMGCPGDVINAFMGHWERGQEPWAKFSSMSPIDYKVTLAKHITKLLGDCGWETMVYFP